MTIMQAMAAQAAMGDCQRVEFSQEDRVTTCWAGCSAPGTGRLGLCERHEKEVLGDRD